MWLIAADWGLHALHIGIIALNLFGWMWARTRRASLACLLITAASWLGLGYFYGLGYCIITDWQWQVKHALGEGGLPASYIVYLLEQMGLRSINTNFVDGIVAGCFGMSLLAALHANFRLSFSAR